MISWADVESIRDYIAAHEQRIRATGYAGERLVDDFRRWWASLSVIDELFRARERYAQASWYRDRANRLMGMPELDPSTHPPSEVPPVADDPTPRDALVPWWIKAAALGAAIYIVHDIMTARYDE